jgi:hypothetical protein
MEPLIALVSAWWIVGLGVIGVVVVLAILWRVALADLVFAAFELP